LDARQAFVHVLGRAALLLEGVLGVLHGDVEQLALRPARRRVERYLARRFALLARRRFAPLTQPFRNAVGAFRQYSEEDLVRAEGAPGTAFVVVLAQERRDDLVVGDLRPRVREARRLDDATRAHVESRQLHDVALTVESEHVLIAIGDGDDS